jgi:proliferating cell nuclear antigen
LVTEVEVKTETENQKGKESQKEHARTILDYDEGFKPEYRNRNKVKTVNVPEYVPEIPEEEEVVAQDDEETVLKAGEPEEQEISEEPSVVQNIQKTEEPKKQAKPTEKQQPTEGKDADFRVGMQTDTWNQVIKMLSTLVEEAKFMWKRDGLKVVVVDPAHVAMYEILIPNEAMSERVAEEGTEFALDLKTFPKLKNGGELYMSRVSKDKVKISNDGVVQTISEADSAYITIPKIPEIKSTCRATVRTESLRKFFEVAENISDAMKMTMHAEGRLVLLAHSDSNKAEMVLDRESGNLLDINMPGERTVSSNYPLEYLIKTVKAATTVTEMDASYRNDYPLEMSFKLPVTTKKNKGRYFPGMIPVRFLLAPRMEQ